VSRTLTGRRGIVDASALTVDSRRSSLRCMSDEIIDIAQYLERSSESSRPEAKFALWGGEGERSRFALPLWRIIYLAQAERGVILWRDASGTGAARPFVVLDLGSDTARTDIDGADLPECREGDAPALHDRRDSGVVVHLGTRKGRTWCLLVDGGRKRSQALAARSREDILFLAGECAGLLFLRDFADQAE
jgi:hypothetical protein